MITADTSVRGNRESDSKNAFSLPSGSFSWENVADYKKKAGMPIVIKGIMCPQDAIKAVECGADAIWVSNHGGR